MANLSYTEKEAIENLLEMKTGYVSDFSNRQFDDFMFTTCKIRIYSDKYSINGNSKACRLRAFWDIEEDLIVGKILQELVKREIVRKPDFNRNEYVIISSAINRLLNISNSNKTEKNKTDEKIFLEKEFKNIQLDELKIDSQIIRIIKNRLEEIKKCINSDSNLAAIILIGSTLEGILLGIASNNIKDFNTAKLSPKDKSLKVLPIYEWKFANLIDVANELKYIGNDVKEFSHVLRNFRNYIHPFHQLSAKFTPDKHTVKICWQVLQAAIYDLTEFNK